MLFMATLNEDSLYVHGVRSLLKSCQALNWSRGFGTRSFITIWLLWIHPNNIYNKLCICLCILNSSGFSNMFRPVSLHKEDCHKHILVTVFKRGGHCSLSWMIPYSVPLRSVLMVSCNLWSGLTSGLFSSISGPKLHIYFPCVLVTLSSLSSFWCL